MSDSNYFIFLLAVFLFAGVCVVVLHAFIVANWFVSALPVTA